jgi:hypothetical protein
VIKVECNVAAQFGEHSGDEGMEATAAIHYIVIIPYPSTFGHQWLLYL